MLGEQSQAGQLYPLVRELIGTGAVALWPIFRFTQTVAGMAAAAAHGGNRLKIILRLRCSRPSPFPIVSSKRRYAASKQ